MAIQRNAAGGIYLENPSFDGRSPWGNPGSPEFARRMRLTPKGAPLPYVKTGHNLKTIVSPDRHRDHPEYFAYWDGQRHVEDEVHPCFTHPDMFDIFMEYVRAGGNSFGINDNLTACKCERCLAIDGESEPYMGMWNLSESYFQLIARVARQTAKEFPGRRLGVYAYQLTDAPPKTVDHIGDNVDVVLCQDTAQHHDPECRRTNQRMSAAWVKKCGHVSFYDYIGVWCWTPRYFPHILADQLRHLSRIGVSGYGTCSPSMIDSSMPMFYLLSQLLWNAELDPDTVVNTMIADLYGNAAEPIGRFYRHWEDCWQRQTESRWLKGLDSFRDEMSVYSWADIERGQLLLDEAATLATDGKVRERIDFLRQRYAFTRTCGHVHTISTNAIRWIPTPHHADAIALSDSVADAWRTWADQLKAAQGLTGIPIPTPLDTPFRVRAWGLKQQMRDAVLAPLVRWACANEGRIEPARLRSIEKELTSVAIANRRAIEDVLVNEIGAAYRKPRADGLQVADVPRAAERTSSASGPGHPPRAGRINAVPWVFRIRPPDQKIGRSDEPMPQNYVDPPEKADLSIAWYCTWDDSRLYIDIVVSDDLHVQHQSAPTMWQEDSVQIAFNVERDNFEYDLSSWEYIWGGYHRNETEFGVSLHDDATETHVWRSPPALPEGIDARSLIRADAAREGRQTVYMVSVDWRLLPGFEPKPERSLGICIVVNDVDRGTRRSAEYGSGVAHAKRPTEFAALRLVNR